MSEYSGPPFRSNIEEWVRTELTSRATHRNRPIVPYVKITPGYHITGNNPVTKPILKGVADFVPGREPNTFTFQQLYRSNNNFRPLPGIKSVNVEYKNVTGAVRKATVSWVCHSKDDMEMMAPYFLNPGRTILIEWGWSIQGQSGILDTTDKYSDWNLTNYYSKVSGKNGKVKQSNGNYDAMLGIIVNFQFSLNRDGGYDCTTEVTSVGDLMAGLSLTNQIARDPMDKGEDKGEDKGKDKGEDTKKTIPMPLREFIEKHLDTYITYDITQIGTTAGGKQNGEGTSLYVVPYGAKDDVYVMQIGENMADKSKQTVKYGRFMSWGYIEDRIINRFIGLYDKDNNPLIWIDSNNVRIGSHPDLRSVDFDICVMPMMRVSSQYNFPSFDVYSNGYHGNPRKILVNVEMFKQIMLQSKTLIEGLGSVLSKICDATGNLWKLRIGTYSDIEKSPVTVDIQSGQAITSISGRIPHAIWKVVDLNNSGQLLSNVYMFRTKSFLEKKEEKRVTSIIRNISLTSKMSNEAALNVYYNGSAEDGTIAGETNIFSWLFKFPLEKGQVRVDDFARPLKHKDIVPRDSPTFKQQETEEQKKAKGQVQEIDWPRELQVYYPLTYPLTYVITDKTLRDAVGPINNLSYGREAMRSAFFFDVPGTNTAKFEAVVPLELEMELEGISGLRAGDIFLIDNFPSIYEKKGVFQIINLSHEVDRTTWKTKIKAQFRVERIKSKTIDEKLIQNAKDAKVEQAAKVKSPPASKKEENVTAKDVGYKNKTATSSIMFRR